jgi:prepilin-type N-terminal cleavage/methylation domain-containing protein
MIKNKAFTLIELITVIAIIAILASLIILSYNNSRARARDAKRQSDLRSVQTGLNIYADEFDFYPDAPSYRTTLCGLNADGFTTGALFCNKDAMSLESWPEDPRCNSQTGLNCDKFPPASGGALQDYAYGYITTDRGSSYVLSASMETGANKYVQWGYKLGSSTATPVH